ncbi:hypothetical protein KDA_41060 [Dictyobacter alpinus]|uniref:GlsB/YeaQ/YmgE family stress response membrane protein n=1 Tax=Dictyobacter alpinus TaxID=2014873 RepID=A0A402BBE9_9CHLR|nr:hypothetical protein [Dictyobacter alpinus]GCE28622.1 hypothetical protein KDA_41060 [Dictyobacter alpinus]
MLWSSLLWLVIGLASALVCLAARLRPAIWPGSSWWIVLAIGAVSGCLGGWLGVWLFGRLFAPFAALWIAILASLLIPRMVVFLRQKV